MHPVRLGVCLGGGARLLVVGELPIPIGCERQRFAGCWFPDACGSLPWGPLPCESPQPCSITQHRLARLTLHVLEARHGTRLLVPLTLAVLPKLLFLKP